MLPLFMPGVVLGLGVAIAFGGLQIGGYSVYGSRELVMIAHSLWAMPLVFMLMEATFRTIDYRIVEASYDLGARPLRTFCRDRHSDGFDRHHLIGALRLRHFPQ